MHYRAKEFPLPGHIADAEALMREMNRAMAAVDGGVDQNNAKGASIPYELIRDSYGSAYMRSTSLVGENDPTEGTLFAEVQQPSGTYTQSLQTAANAYSGAEGEANRNTVWEWLQKSAVLRLKMNLEVREATRLHIILNGQTQIPEQGVPNPEERYISEFDVRIMVNNRPLDEMGSFSCTANEGWMPFHLHGTVIIRPGVNRIGAQIRDRTFRVADAAEPVLKISNTYLYCYGYTR
jgi:hypothetical protein